MTDIDITAAIRPTSDAIYRQLSGQYGDFSTPSDEEAEAVLKAAREIDGKDAFGRNLASRPGGRDDPWATPARTDAAPF